MPIERSAFSLTKEYVKNGVPFDSCHKEKGAIYFVKEKCPHPIIHSGLTGLMKLNVGIARVVRYVPAAAVTVGLAAVGLGLSAAAILVALPIWTGARITEACTENTSLKMNCTTIQQFAKNIVITPALFLIAGGAFAGIATLNYSGGVLCFPAVGLDHLRDGLIHQRS